MRDLRAQAQEGADAADDLARNRHRRIASGAARFQTGGFDRLVQRHHQHIFRIIGRKHRGEGVDHLVFVIAATLARLFRRAGFARHRIARHIGKGRCAIGHHPAHHLHAGHGSLGGDDARALGVAIGMQQGRRDLEAAVRDGRIGGGEV